MPAPPTGLGSPTPFDGQAPQFDRRVGLPESDCRAIAAAVLALARAHPGDRLLEIGAGTGMIGRWFLEHPVRYVGLDLSRGMLEVFRRRPGAARAGLVQADGARSWPLPAGAARVVFSSRAIHLLPLAHVLDEVFRVVAGAPDPANGRVAGGEEGPAPDGGGACLLGWVERGRDSVKARMSRAMQRLVRERGFTPRTAGGRGLLAACRERGAALLPRTVVARWPALHTPRQSLDSWRSKPGLGGVVLPPGVQESLLDELQSWAVRTFGSLDAARPDEESYVLEGVRLPPPGASPLDGL
ncbi:MAG: class I SAM-dependent methyltransferase [Acidobacteria bacterium]|nr:class I SAM-dependent methyltransferase [Acidobacteriota bacterium]